MNALVCSVLALAIICQSHSHSVRSPLDTFKRYQESAWSDPNDCSSSRQPFSLSNPYNFSVDLRMPGVTPKVSDTYFCVAVPVPMQREAYIVDFVPHASMDTAHHMLLFGCTIPFSTKGYWDCGSEQGTCEDEAKIMYAWARNAPPTKLPQDVGFKVGGDTGITHFVLQIHYGDVTNFRDHHRDCSGLTLRMTSKPQPFIAGMYLMMSMNTVIPPGKKVVNADISCTYSSYPMHPFAFRTHTHRLGKVVSGYRVRNGQWTLIGRQSPQLPQAFYPASNHIDVKYGDTLAARCVFTGEGRTTKTRIGGTSDDEMCNFYIMYYMDSKHAVPYMDCMDGARGDLFKNIPAEANVPIPVTPDHLMSMMHGSAHHSGGESNRALQQPKREEEEVLDQGDFYSLLSKLLGEKEDVVHVHKYNPSEAAAKIQADLVAEIDSIMQKKDLGWPRPRLDHKNREDAILVRDRVHKFHQLESTVRPPGSKTTPFQQPGAVGAKAEKQGAHLVEVPDWPETPLQLGQVSGLALMTDDNLVIFHRGDHRWGVNSFDNEGRYQQRSLGPIQQSTILVVDPVKGNVIKASGRNMFYLPHGITVDTDNNYWVTDVALHQVFKLGSDGKDKPLVVLGEAFEPGSDRNHFCKPTDVAVDPVTGNVFISDGYCNARILKFSPDGKYLSHWGAGSSDRRRRVPFQIPHSLAFLPDRHELCVADRENGRIQCFVAETGEFVKEIKKDEFGGEVFAVSYAPVHGGLIYAVNGESAYGQSAPLQGFVVNYSTKEILDTFRPDTQEFKMPHDIVVTRDGSVFVGDAATDSVIKFVSSEKEEHRSVKKGGIEVQEIEETEYFVQSHLKPVQTQPAQTHVEKTALPPQSQVHEALTPEEKQKIKSVTRQSSQGVSPAVVTTLLLVPLVVVIAIGVFIRWKKSRMYGDDCEVKLEPSGSSGGILGKLRGKAAGTLNLGNFFASHKGYTRQGFDRLSTEGSDLDKDDEDATDSENEEYSAPPPPVSSSQ
ncbi:peptidyl-glycine alpha-amidating monooxygenase B isoform X1 [Chanos chanos]|uniref:Peptidyl-glycine alpha-amidating monooxygenase isoform X1 n=1 Tax=Chanos chanos TaxID=29144 RepID=A0A6J2V1J9_CHACN|nr:peptidyl-glycine alpha-amidating monooxygenase isoform X1 [Chanos chanos]XP_030626114.1 peptidyl-glycine alpha-amidating monooxygenase isoform X1 [Chanos chanos]